MSYSLLQYSARYRTSWALVIGINRYRHMPPLRCAAKDAADIADTLMARFGFPSEQVILLQDELATRDNILSVFDTLISQRNVATDDRIMVFFAGHGLTRETRDGSMVGYIAPIDAEPRQWRTLIRMSDLISQARFLSAKHILFILDACYSGLSLRRSSPFDPVVERFLTRPAVQVMTAGRADEMVIDGGDPQGDHSVFTGYLLDALNGGATTASGLMTASDVMQYVYRHVIDNPDVDQTPQYGWLDGDGDFVFQLPYRASLPAPLELSLRQGSVPGRLATIHELTTIASEPGEQQALAIRRLHDITELDPDPRVSVVAGNLLGVPTSVSRRPPTVIDSTARVRVEMPASPVSVRSPRYAEWLLSLVGLSAVLLGGLLALYATSAWSTKQVHGADPTPVEAALLPLPSQTPTAESPASTPTEHHAGRLARPADSAVLFYDDFALGLSAWSPMPDSGSVERTASDGTLQFKVNSTYSLWMTQPTGISVDNGTISVQATARSAPPNSAFGLVFRQIDLDNYYFYQVRTDGNFALSVQRGGLVHYLIEARPLNHRTFDGQPHELAVQMEGPVITLYVDGQEIATTQDSSISYGRIGLAVQTQEAAPAAMSFDDFAAYLP